MYIGVCVYNALSQWVRGIKVTRYVVTVSIGTMAILAGISISLTPNPSDLLKLIMVILVFGGLIVCAMSYGQAHRGDWQELNRQRSEFYRANETLSELKSINKGISGLHKLLTRIKESEEQNNNKVTNEGD